MNNLYQKVAVASVCTAIGFVLGASPEVKATSFTFAPNITSEIIDGQFNGHIYDGLGDEIALKIYSLAVARGTSGEVATLTEFNINSFYWHIIQLLVVLFYRLKFLVFYSLA